MVSWVKCSTWLYRLLTFVFSLTFNIVFFLFKAQEAESRERSDSKMSRSTEDGIEAGTPEVSDMSIL